jgi:hypothetical protein
MPIANYKLVVLCLLLLTLALAAPHPVPALAQTKPERFWLAGRYDGNRVIVYFDAVKFNGALPSASRPLPEPVVPGFFSPVEPPAGFVASFENGSAAERFAIGDRYDLLEGYDAVATIKLTTLIACETDEQVGNDSYIGALGTLEDSNSFLLPHGYYAVRHHQERSGDAAKRKPVSTAFASLRDEPVRFDVQTRIAALLSERLTMEPNEAARKAEKIPLAFSVQRFTIVNGSVRYYVSAEWRSAPEPQGRQVHALAAWIAPSPKLHVLAADTIVTDGGEPPKLLNVVDLGGGKTGIIVELIGGDSGAVNLLEYRDAISLRKMPLLQSISMGE